VAIRHLVAEGLVVSRLNHGACVAAISADDARDIYRARQAIEVAAVNHAMHDAGRLEFDHLRAAHELCVTVASSTDRPLDEQVATNLDFHRAIVALARSPRLTRAHEPLAAESQILLNLGMVSLDEDVLVEHERIMAAITARSPAAAVALVGHHLSL
jgi:DNA-binding GntR family transcriptional regulator